jgi:hypothetical protein
MSQLTKDRITICDINGLEQSMICIEGQTLEQYFDHAGVLAPIQGQVALVDGLPINLKEVVEPGTSVTVGVLAKNG